MEPVRILAIGADEKIMQTVLRLINGVPSWEGNIALRTEEAQLKIQSEKFDVVLLGSGSDESQIRKILKDSGLNIPVVLHYGGGSGLLFCEIKQALEIKK